MSYHNWEQDIHIKEAWREDIKRKYERFITAPLPEIIAGATELRLVKPGRFTLFENRLLHAGPGNHNPESPRRVLFFRLHPPWHPIESRDIQIHPTNLWRATVTSEHERNKKGKKELA